MRDNVHPVYCRHIKIIDVSRHQNGIDLTSEAPAEDVMDVNTTELAAGVDTPGTSTLSWE